jgi:hypothetical protein
MPRSKGVEEAISGRRTTQCPNSLRITRLNTSKRTSHHVLERTLFTNGPSLDFKPLHNARGCDTDSPDTQNDHTKP